MSARAVAAALLNARTSSRKSTFLATLSGQGQLRAPKEVDRSVAWVLTERRAFLRAPDPTIPANDHLKALRLSKLEHTFGISRVPDGSPRLHQASRQCGTSVFAK